MTTTAKQVARGVMAAAAAAALLAGAAAAPQVDHVIVFMFENRAFDHMVGMMANNNTNIDGCTLNDTRPACSCPLDPSDPASPRVHYDNQAVYVQPADPDHSVAGTHLQMFGVPLADDGDGASSSSSSSSAPLPAVPPMTGFIESYTAALHKYNKSEVPGSFIMHGFDPEHVPIITTLASEFALFDAWHASVPGPTEVNRCFAWSATSDGMATNDKWRIALGMPQKTIFQTLDEANSSWGVFFEDFPSAIVMSYPRYHLEHLHTMDEFKAMAANGTLPAFSFVEPRYYDDFGKPARDQHPDHDVAAGEEAMREVYEAVRNGAAWERSALLITYDEHGGFDDHVPPPTAPSPDGKVSTKPPFNFTRLGLRVPSILISPYVPKGTVVHGGDGGAVFEHSSIPATVRKLFAPAAAPLTRRDATAATFEGVLSLAAPRTDCPASLPPAPTHRAITPGLPPLSALGAAPMSDLQKGFAVVAAHVNGEMVDGLDGMVEREGAALVNRHMAALQARGSAVASA
eukprot:CAMPEP_0203833176 /NCGR_PEP_ID=MMETSP0115-20131106/72522_1 /ASSEMBLY_ACC=CAM_ASM_000227 /TAXON_ID=33651 /ORGANISM="Bicosoecid sp, Strain ms1" /LENGTH=515 /DNA_ID=CAMNT_0050742247 /DNA_START=135 /DNA_END=1682 /DNA_ORIENTATION=+